MLVCENPKLHLRQTNAVVAHLDKSHLTAHTYPEYHPKDGVCTFRVDIDVSTCGEISPLNALKALIDYFEADIMTLDYRVRGFTRDVTGHKLFIDHKIDSIQDYFDDGIKNQYESIDTNLYHDNIFHTKSKIKQFDLSNYLFKLDAKGLSAERHRLITTRLMREMNEIYYGMNAIRMSEM
jgi:S-adenosylmethionine decarboxylase